MEEIELKSEKTRNIIGKIPPIIIRYGNMFILLFLLAIFTLAISVRLPKIQYGEIVIHKGEKQVVLFLHDIDQQITKGNKMRIYKNGRLMYQTSIPYTVDSLQIKDDYFFTTLLLEIPSFSLEGISFDMEENTRFNVEIETKKERFIEYLIR